MKALLLCAGRGNRLRPLTHVRAKAMIPTAGRPVIAHVLDQVVRAGIREVALVISPQQPEFRVLIGSGKRWGLRVRYLYQHKPRGIADAVRLGQRFVGADPFMVYLGDNLVGHDLRPLVELVMADRPDALLLLKEVPNPSAFGVAVLDGERVRAVLEKPVQPPSRQAITGIYFFSPAIFAAIETITPSARGELEITDAISRLIQANRRVIWRPLEGFWHDMGSLETILEANAALLERMEPQIDPDALVLHSRIEGPVSIGQGCKVVNCTLRGPLIIGRATEVYQSFLGPFTSLGEGVRLTGCHLENSIVSDGCRLERIPFPLSGCLLGSDCQIRGETVGVAAAALILGDRSRLLLPGRPER